MDRKAMFLSNPKNAHFKNNGTKVYILFAKNNEKTYFFYWIVI